MDNQFTGAPQPAGQPEDVHRLLAAKDLQIAAMQKKLEKYEAIFQGLSDGVLLIDETLSECNQEACQIWKCEKEDIIGFFPSDFAPLFQPDGENSYVLATFKDITDLKIKENEKQALLHMMEKIIEDRTRTLQEYNESLNEEIARRKRTERNLEHAYMELEHIFDTSGDGILVLDSDRNIVRANLAFAELVEQPVEGILGKKCFDIFPCRHRCTDHCIIQEIVIGSSKTDFEKEFVSISGERKSCLVKAAALRGKGGEVLGIVKNYKDLTSYRRWVDRLQESEEFHRITLESIWDAIFLTTDEGRIVFVSCNVAGIFGYEADEIQEFGSIFDLVGGQFYSPHELAMTQELRNLEVEITDKDGQKRTLIANVKRAYLRSGTTLIAFRDITERKNAEKRAKIEYEQLVQAGKMVSLGILVSGVAHEINNPNNSIILNVPLLSRMWYDARIILDQYMDEHGDFMLGSLRYSYAREHVPQLFAGVMASSRRIKHIVQDLKNYARQGSTVMNEVIDINGVLRAAILLLDNQLQKATNRLTIGYGFGIPHFRGNFQKVEQVVINILQNACEALNDKGKAIRVHTGFDSDRGQIWLKVADEGQGIGSDDLPHVTDPFYTTKRTCGGTGLGLSISSRIMQEHGGELAIESRQGEGTLVTLTLPIRQEGDAA
jgi:PAS domain S-box-containing protein